MKPINDLSYYFLCYLFLIFAVIVICEQLTAFDKPWHLIVAVRSVFAIGAGFICKIENP
jgi:glucan phosphoethanolaminetransferase (alkaline phosphatase superfamily)